MFRISALRTSFGRISPSFTANKSSTSTTLALTLAAGAAVTVAYTIQKSRSNPQDHLIPANVRDESNIERFIINNDNSSTITLTDGRKLGYAQYGLSSGKPVFWLHGHPGSRLEGAGFDSVAKEAGLRLICVDRPGFGWSDPQPDRKLLDLPRDIEQLAKYLELDSYGVVGISGGGPSALACAYGLPAENLKCVCIIVGMGPPDIGMSGADLIHRLGFPHGYRMSPVWAVRKFWEAEQRLDLNDEQRTERLLHLPVSHEKDLAFLKSDWPRLGPKVTREAFSRGFEAVALDGKLMCSDFGFKVEDIRKDLPVHLWYGKHDCFVPANHGVQIAARLGSNAQLHICDETHASIVVNGIRNIFKNLAAAL